MVLKRLIVNLLWRNGHIVQSVGFKHTNVVGDPRVAIECFNAWDADEIALLNVDRDEASFERFLGTLQHISKSCFLPLAAGGWVNSLDRATQLIQNGADKLVINSAGFERPAFFREVADVFGSQCVVASIDVRGNAQDGWEVYVDRGRRALGLNVHTAARLAVEHGAGEILLTSIDRDGSLKGYDLELIKSVADAVAVPVIAFGGVGQWTHLAEGIGAHAEAVSAGNIFHFTEQSTRAAKRFLQAANLPVR